MAYAPANDASNIELLYEEEGIEEGTPQPRRSRVTRRGVFVAVTLVAVVAVLALYANQHSQSTISVSGDYVQQYSALKTCYGFTGGTCLTKECDGNRHAQCVSHQCTCVASCSAANGTCIMGQINEPIKTAFTLTNVNWPKYAMYFQSTSAFGQLKTTNSFSWMNTGKDKFSLDKLVGSTDLRPAFFLGSERWPQTVARMALTTGTAIAHTHAVYATGLDKSKATNDLAWYVCYNAEHRALMFSNLDRTYWAYMPHGSWLAYGFCGTAITVGTAGMWTTTPPLTNDEIRKLPDCRDAHSIVAR